MASTDITTTTSDARTTYLLIGDIGGTNSRLRLYDTSNSEPLAGKDYENEKVFKQDEDHKGAFERLIIGPFLQYCREESKLKPTEECVIVSVFAVAGPVEGNKATLTNLGITIDGEVVQETFTEIMKCLIINDFIAQGYGCLSLDLNETPLDPDKIRELSKDAAKLVDPTGVKVCVGAGTGLGECFLTHNGSGYTCYPSEGGHVEFNPRSDLEIKLRASLMSKFNYDHRLSVERVVSGTGLANVYEYLAESPEHEHMRDDTIHEMFMNAGDLKGKVVAENVKNNEICKIAMDIMISAYGSEVGSAALKWIPTGGLYVTGGLTPKNITHIEGEDSLFMKAYNDKGRASVVLKKVPLFAVMVDDLGVRGAHYVCTTEYKRMRIA